jgi:hypothetical protein
LTSGIKLIPLKGLYPKVPKHKLGDTESIQSFSDEPLEWRQFRRVKDKWAKNIKKDFRKVSVFDVDWR